jgi:acetate---CoA ligase (ADP-forming)
MVRAESHVNSFVRGAMTATRSLRPLFAPASVAVVGASNDPRKWGNWLARGAVGGESRRPAYLVNRRGGEILGRPAYRTLAALAHAAAAHPELCEIEVNPLLVTATEAIGLDARCVPATEGRS